MRRYFILFILALISVACDPVSENAPEFEQKQKTVLVYMVANNNLSSNAENNLSSMKGGYIPSDDNLLVYMHLSNSTPVLLRLHKDGS
ncbi:MAG: hypothetical protein IKB26_02230, partial [Bacteroidales bacterium]|nr:hypothetical protein [Bacteroidales bacterium]